MTKPGVRALALAAALTCSAAAARGAAQSVEVSTRTPAAVTSSTPVALPVIPIVAPSPPPPPLPTLPERLGVLLDANAARARQSRHVAAGVTFGLGAAYALGGGILLANMSSAGDPTSIGVGAGLLVGGGLLGITGVITLLFPTQAESWSREYAADLARSGDPNGAYDRALGRWGLAVARERSAARTAAVVNIVLGGVVVVAGGTLLVAPGLLGRSLASVNASFGALFMVLGGLNVSVGIAGLFNELPSEAMLRTFRTGAGLVPPPAPSRIPAVSFAPTPGGVALSAVWRL